MERMDNCISFTEHPSYKIKKKKRTINTGHFTPICNTAMCGVTTGKNIDGKLFLSLTLQQGKKYGHFSIKVVFIFNDITFGKQ